MSSYAKPISAIRKLVQEYGPQVRSLQLEITPALVFLSRTMNIDEPTAFALLCLTFERVDELESLLFANTSLSRERLMDIIVLRENFDSRIFNYVADNADQDAVHPVICVSQARLAIIDGKLVSQFNGCEEFVEFLDDKGYIMSSGWIKKNDRGTYLYPAQASDNSRIYYLNKAYLNEKGVLYVPNSTVNVAEMLNGIVKFNGERKQTVIRYTPHYTNELVVPFGKFTTKRSNQL